MNGITSDTHLPPNQPKGASEIVENTKVPLLLGTSQTRKYLISNQLNQTSLDLYEELTIFDD